MAARCRVVIAVWRTLAVVVVTASPALPADFDERWPHPVAVDPAPVIDEPAPIVVARYRQPPEQNVCTRHHLHKVITRGGRSWRCAR
jgi:hypothetical protein